MEKKVNPFKEQIKIEMLKKGYTQTKMADLLGISNQAFSAWLNSGNPKIETLDRVAKILGVSSNYFFGSGNIQGKKVFRTPAIVASEISTGNIAGKRGVAVAGYPAQCEIMSREIELIKKDIELLKKEIEILKLTKVDKEK